MKLQLFSDLLVTHHVPTWAQAHTTGPWVQWNPFFIADITSALARYLVAVHGHSHRRQDYRLGHARVVANPRGVDRDGNVHHPVVLEV